MDVNAPEPVSRTLPFVPAAIEMRLLALLDGDPSHLPALAGADGDPLHHRVASTAGALAAGLRLHGVHAARALHTCRLAEIVAEVADRRGVVPCPDARVVGVCQGLGEIYVWHLLDELSGDAPVEQLIDLARRYRSTAAVTLGRSWMLPREVVQSCKDPSHKLSPGMRLGLVALHLVEAVDAVARGGQGHGAWNKGVLASLGVTDDAARAVVAESAEVLLRAPSP